MSDQNSQLGAFHTVTGEYEMCCQSLAAAGPS